MNTREPTGLPLRRQRENVKSQHHASTFTSSCPAKRGRGTTLRSRVVEGASASKLALPPHAPSTMLRHSRRFAAACLISKNGGQRPPMPPPPALRAGADKQNRSRDAFMRPSFANRDDAKNKFASSKQREAERRKAHAIHVRAAQTSVRSCATHLLRGCAP